MKLKIKHELKVTSTVFIGTCGDHYCGGHYDSVIECKCGWTKTVSENSLDLKEELLEHRLSFLEGTDE